MNENDETMRYQITQSRQAIKSLQTDTDHTIQSLETKNKELTKRNAALQRKVLGKSRNEQTIKHYKPQMKNSNLRLCKVNIQYNL